MRIRTHRQVWLYSSLITALSVAVPTCVMAVALERAPWRFKMMVFAPTAIIPLLIALPISIFALNMMRLLSQTIESVDRLVKYDPLTGLMSRSFFLQAARERMAAGGCLMIIDADFFKNINDTYGHDVGDEALRLIAKCLMQATDPGSLVGRLGGEEFAVYLEKSLESEASLTASRILEAARSVGSAVGEVGLSLTVSIGVQIAEPGSSLESVIKNADVLLYDAKRGGRDRFVVGREPRTPDGVRPPA